MTSSLALGEVTFAVWSLVARPLHECPAACDACRPSEHAFALRGDVGSHSFEAHASRTKGKQCP